MMAFLIDSSVFGWVVGAVLFFLVNRLIIAPVFLSPLAKIPNAHWSASFSSLWILFIRLTNKENRTLLNAHRRLGPVVRVAPGQLSINDFESVRTVYQGGFEKTNWYSVFDNYGVPCMFSIRPAREHSARKRMISNAYSKSYIQSSASSAEQARVILFGRLLPIITHSTSESQAPHGVDVYSIFLATTMDFIAAYLFGIRNGTNFLQNPNYRDHWLELYKARSDYGFFPQELPRLTALCRKIGISLYPDWVDSANEELREWNKGLCEATLNACSDPKADTTNSADDPVVTRILLSGLAKEKETSGGDFPLSPAASAHHRLTVYSELFDHILAGQETAGLALTYLSWRLSQSPELQHQLRAELLTLQPNMKLGPDGSCSLPSSKQLDGLPLLHAVVMETLRLHAPLPGPEPRQTPLSGCQIGPYRVPGGVRIAALPYALHRDEGIFPDPERWDHTRWLDSNVSDEARKVMNRQFWAFGSGGRMCIGSNFAMQEMKLITAAIYSNFTTHIVDDVGMAEPTDSYSGRPSSEQLYLRFEQVG